MSQPETQYQLHPHARFRVLPDDGAGVFVLQESGEVLEVNAVGACIVDTLRKTGRLGDAVDEVRTRFDIDGATAARDAEDFVNSLLAAEALRVSPSVGES